MGQCVCKKSNSLNKANQKTENLITSNNYKQVLTSNRVKVIEKIHQLHKINLTCKQGIENCVIGNNKNLALVLRLKRAYIQRSSEALRDIVKEIDELLVFVGARMTAIRSLVQNCEKVLSESTQLIDNNVASILDGQKKVLTEIQKEIVRFSVLSTEVEEENEKAFEVVNRSNIVRRTYRKALRV